MFTHDGGLWIDRAETRERLVQHFQLHGLKFSNVILYDTTNKLSETGRASIQMAYMLTTPLVLTERRLNSDLVVFASPMTFCRDRDSFSESAMSLTQTSISKSAVTISTL